MLSAASAAADENAAASEPQAGPKSPWGGNLSAYLWTAGMKADVSAGTHGGSVDASFIDIWDKSTRVPLGFMGRLEVHYERFGVFVDGNYMDIRLKPLFGRVSEGINSEMGLMDYGLAYRLFGAPASVVADQYQGRKRPNMLDVYVGARTLWIGNSISFAGPFGLVQRSPQTNRSLTAPYVGMRFGVDFTPQWFLLADANFGGFGVDAVSFTGGLLGAVGYRTRWFGVPTSLEAGFRAIRYNVDAHQATAANVTLNGPFIGLTGYW
jgi:hypothetical protein